MNKLCDRVIVSSNESWLYLDFWPLVAYAYRTIFPESKITLAFLTERCEDDPFVAQLRLHGDVRLVTPRNDITQAAQAKLARSWVAAQCGDEVCLIEDIDIIPIDREWWIGKTSQRQPGTMLLIGSECYGDSGQCPASMMTAEGHVYRALFNPKGLPFGPWIDTLKTGSSGHTNVESRTQNEGMDCSTSAERMGAPLFSDEALIIELRKKNPVPVTLIERGYKTGIDTIDRSYWGAFDPARLEAGGYLVSHTGRPYRQYKVGNDLIMQYIKKRYNGGDLPPMLEKQPAIDRDMKFGGSGITIEAYNWIIDNIPKDSLILELGSGHTSTNYLSRYYWMLSVESERDFVNIYPAHYVYAPITDGWFNVKALQEGLVHPRIRERGKCTLLIVDGPKVMEPESRASVLKYLELFPLEQPIMVDDTWREAERELAEHLGRCAGRPVTYYHNQFAII